MITESTFHNLTFNHTVMKGLQFIIALLVGVASFAQRPKITGLGNFQIGKSTISIISALSKEYNVAVQETSNQLATSDEYNYNDTPSKILYLSKDANEGKLFSHSRYEPHGKIKVYYINNIRIADLIFHDVWLKFYNDTLYYIETDADEYIDSALTIKYGQPKIRQKAKTIQCSNAYRSIEYQEWTYFKSWDNSLKNIEATRVKSKKYDNDCKEYTLEYLTVYDTKKELLVFNEMRKAEKEAQAKRDKERSKALSDL